MTVPSCRPAALRLRGMGRPVIYISMIDDLRI